MAGTVNISRDLWDDPTFKDSEMSQREAWIWMIAEASWKARARRFGSTEIELQRGQLAASTRFMAKAWMWSEPRVRRYLDMLENRRMITRVTDAGVTVITISKYNDYQNGPRVGDAPSTQQPTQDRRTSDANEKKGEIRDKLEDGGGRAQSDDLPLRERLLWAAGIDPQTVIDRGPGAKGGSLDMAEADRWIDLFQGDVDAVVRHISDIRSGMNDPPGTLRYFTKPLQKIAGAKSKPPLRPIEGSPHERPSSRNFRSASSDDAFVRIINAAAGSGRTS